METERKLLKLPLGFRSKIPRRGIYEYQRPENFAKHNALCKRDENYGILMGKPNNAICLDYDIYDPNCKDKQKYTRPEELLWLIHEQSVFFIQALKNLGHTFSMLK